MRTAALLNNSLSYVTVYLTRRVFPLTVTVAFTRAFELRFMACNACSPSQHPPLTSPSSPVSISLPRERGSCRLRYVAEGSPHRSGWRGTRSTSGEHHAIDDDGQTSISNLESKGSRSEPTRLGPTTTDQLGITGPSRRTASRVSQSPFRTTNKVRETTPANVPDPTLACCLHLSPERSSLSLDCARCTHIFDPGQPSRLGASARVLGNWFDHADAHQITRASTSPFRAPEI